MHSFNSKDLLAFVWQTEKEEKTYDEIHPKIFEELAKKLPLKLIFDKTMKDHKLTISLKSAIRPIFKKGSKTISFRPVSLTSVVCKVFKKSFCDQQFTLFIMVLLFKSLIRPISEYTKAVWSPYKRKDIDLIEQIQRQITTSKCIIGMRKRSYSERLIALKLPNFEFRCICGDLVEVYTILHCKYDTLTTENLLIPFIGKITTKLILLSFSNSDQTLNNIIFFTNRVNNLPEKIVSRVWRVAVGSVG